MKEQYINIIENFVKKSINKYKSEYLILTNFCTTSKYITMFKTNLNTHKTVDNILEILKYIDNIINITNDKNSFGGGVRIQTSSDYYYLFDYTGGVIE